MSDEDDVTSKAQTLEASGDARAQTLHELDAQNLTLYIALLILAVLTTWIFKQKKFRFIHETGVTLLYGATVGFILWLIGAPNNLGEISVTPLEGEKIDWEKGPPQYLRLNDTTTNLTHQRTVLYEISTLQVDNPIEEKAAFSPEIFFNILLPPIIFNAGYQMKKKQFFRNLGTILLYAILGTLLSALIIGYLMFYLVNWTISLTFTLQETLFFGALISATDPVTVLSIFGDIHVERDLYALVMGESCLNDAVAIVLSDTIKQYMPHEGGEVPVMDLAGFFGALGSFFAVFFGSLVIGVLLGMATALFMKFARIREHPLMETSLFLLMSYLSFTIAEAAGVTGIVAVLFCGMTQAHYTYNNLSEESQLRTKELFEMLNFLAETFVFLYIGVSLFASHSTKFNFLFVLYAIFAIGLARAVFIYGLTLIVNFWRKPKIPMNYQHMLVWSGLRGAVAYALALRTLDSEQRRYIYTATSIIVTATVLVNGGLTKLIIDKLHIKYGEEIVSETAMQPRSSVEEEISGEPRTRPYNPWDKSFLPRKWYNIDAKFFKPLLTHARPSLIETLPSCMGPIARILTTDEQVNTRFTDENVPVGTIANTNGDILDAQSPPVLRNDNISTSTARIV